MGESLRRSCVPSGMSLQCNTQRVCLSLRWSSLRGVKVGGGGYNSIPITLVGTVLQPSFFLGEWPLDIHIDGILLICGREVPPIAPFIHR